MFLLECLLFISHPIIIHIPFFHWVPHHSNNPFLESSPIVYQYQTPSLSSICISQLHIYSCITPFCIYMQGGRGDASERLGSLLLCATHFYIDMFHLLSKPSQLFPCFDWKINLVSSSLTNSFEIQILISCWFFKRKWKGRN